MAQSNALLPITDSVAIDLDEGGYIPPESMVLVLYLLLSGSTENERYYECMARLEESKMHYFKGYPANYYSTPDDAKEAEKQGRIRLCYFYSIGALVYIQAEVPVSINLFGVLGLAGSSMEMKELVEVEKTLQTYGLYYEWGFNG